MNYNYKPASTDYIDTQHGTINTRKQTYNTQRTHQHYFIKKKGFGISITELETAIQHNVKTIQINYKKTNGDEIIYQIPLKTALTHPKHQNQEDHQIIIQKNQMTKISGG